MSADAASADPGREAPAGQVWTKEIGPKRPLLALPWRELWSYRELVGLLARRDLLANYQQTLLGPFWIFIQPLMASIVFSFLFGRMGKFGTNGMPHLLFYLGGLIPWALCADTVTKTSLTFIRNAPLFGKIYFPRFIVPLASVGTSLVTFAIQLVLFLGLLGFYLWKGGTPVDPNWRIALLPVILAPALMLGLGMGCIVSSLSTRYRDLSYGITFFVQMWMYGSSIIFPVSRIAADHPWILYVNPMIPVVEGFRFAFLGSGVVEKSHLAVSFGVSALVLLIGLILFNRAEQNAADAL